jgi:hypothetical protein
MIAMTGRYIDFRKLRQKLQRMKRGDLLMIAMRAAEVLPLERVEEVLGGLLQLEDLSIPVPYAAPDLLDDVREFHAASMAGAYYESFNVNSRNCMEHSAGTDAFIAELERLMSKCVGAAQKGSSSSVRESFELLFALIRHIDGCHDDVLFFADDGGTWEFGVDWNATLAAYFRCLAETTEADEFARIVDQAITDFEAHDRPRHMAAALSVATAAQKAALDALPRR